MNVIYRLNAGRKNKLNAELDKIINTLSSIPGVERVILFGSMVSGEPGISSDLDLLVIQKTEKAFLSRLIEINKQLNPEVAVDILVYTPEEYSTMIKEPNSFMRSILKNGRVVYEKQRN